MLVVYASIILIIIWLVINNCGGGYPAWKLIMYKFVGNSIPVLEIKSTQLAIVLPKKSRTSFVEDVLV